VVVMRDQLKSIDRSNSLNGGRASLKFLENISLSKDALSVFITRTGGMLLLPTVSKEKLGSGLGTRLLDTTAGWLPLGLTTSK